MRLSRSSPGTDDGIDGPSRQTCLRQSSAQLLFRDDTERERSTCDFGDDGGAFGTRQARGAGT